MAADVDEAAPECVCALGRSDVLECMARSPEGYVCTREAGHPGMHVACSAYRHRRREW